MEYSAAIDVLYKFVSRDLSAFYFGALKDRYVLLRNHPRPLSVMVCGILQRLFVDLWNIFINIQDTFLSVARGFRPSGENHCFEKKVIEFIVIACSKYSCIVLTECSGLVAWVTGKDWPCCLTHRSGPKFCHMTADR